MAENEVKITDGRFEDVRQTDDKFADSLVRKYCEDYPIYKKPAYTEQLRLMIQWKFREETIKRFAEGSFKPQDIDFFRIVMLLINDPEYIEQHFIGKTFDYQKSLDEVVSCLFSRQYPQLADTTQLLVEKETLKKEFEIQKDFIAKQYDSDLRFKVQQYENEKDKAAIVKKYEDEKKDMVIAELRKELESAMAENAQLKKDNGVVPPGSGFGKKKHLFSCFIKKESEPEKVIPAEEKEPEGEPVKTVMRKEDFLAGILGDLRFEPKQYDVILYDDNIGLPLEYLMKIARPDLPVLNMIYLSSIYAKICGIPFEYKNPDKPYKQETKEDVKAPAVKEKTDEQKSVKTPEKKKETQDIPENEVVELKEIKEMLMLIMQKNNRQPYVDKTASESTVDEKHKVIIEKLGTRQSKDKKDIPDEEDDSDE